MDWLWISYRVPGKGSTARVTVWREARRSGALALHRALVVFPDTPAFRGRAERFRLLVAEQGGESVALTGAPLSGADARRLVAEWNEARGAEYAELISECGKLEQEIAHEFEIEKFTLAELEEEESELEKLEQWLARIAERDVCEAANGEAAMEAFGRAKDEVARYATEVFKRSRA